jgi:cyclopropane fatty-acyl-phospholipid synthase-like methyltransferase
MMLSKPNEDARNECPACKTAGSSVFFEMPSVPLFCNVLLPDVDSSVSVPRGDISLSFCPACGLIFNSAFDAELMNYEVEYENSLHFSPRFQDYANELAKRLVSQYELQNKTILEIACGQGDFLSLLCEMGGNTGVGFDPSHAKRALEEGAEDRITFVRDYYSEKYAHYQGDLVVCRHMLEHVPKPKEFLTSLRKTLGDDSKTAVFFEVPNSLHTLEKLAIWDIIYEHCLYLTPLSISLLFESCGFEVARTDQTYEGQFLTLDATPCAVHPERSDRSEELEALGRAVQDFPLRFEQKADRWRKQLNEIAERKRTTVIWGAGSKGVTFLNVMETGKRIKYAVDMNPRKRGMFIAGTGHEIVSPEDLKEIKPSVVLVMNAIYEEEVRKTTIGLGLDVDIVTV